MESWKSLAAKGRLGDALESMGSSLDRAVAWVNMMKTGGLVEADLASAAAEKEVGAFFTDDCQWTPLTPLPPQLTRTKQVCRVHGVQH